MKEKLIEFLGWVFVAICTLFIMLGMMVL